MEYRVYNAVCYDGVAAYVIKTIGTCEEEAREQFNDSDLEILKMDFLYPWLDMEEHIVGALRGEYKLGDGKEDLKNAIKRFVKHRNNGLDLLVNM